MVITGKRGIELKKINISQISTFFANGSYPIEFLFYFPNKINTKKLRKALKKTAKIFWPVFGSYSEGIITEEIYHEDRYYEEKTMDKAFDSSTVREEMFTSYGGLTPDVSRRLFYLLVLQMNNGTILIPKMNHLVGDGYSYFYLLSVLAALTRRISIPLASEIISAIFKPTFHSLLNDSFYFTAMPVQPIKNDSEIIVEYIELDQNEVRIQAQYASEIAGTRISTNDILSAMVVKMILDGGKMAKSQNFQLMLPVDMRRRVNEFGQRFFGNPLIMHNVPFEPIASKQLSIEEIAIAIRKSYPEVNRSNYESYQRTIEGWMESGQ